MTPLESNVSITSLDGAPICGIFRPALKRKRGFILLLHGITTQKNEYGSFFARLAQSFAELGYSSLRIDFRGHGDSPVPQSAFSITSQFTDTVAAIRWIKKKHRVNHVELFGCSFGSPPAILAADFLNKDVKHLILMCPVLSYRRTFFEQATLWAKEVFSKKALRSWINSGALRIAPHFSADVKLMLEMRSVDPIAVLQNLRNPCLIIHGTADSMVPVAVSKEAATIRSGIKSLFIKNMDHGYGDASDESGTGPKSESNFNAIVAAVDSFLSDG